MLSTGKFLFLITLFHSSLIVSLQLKGEYKQVKTLRALSGFGWDEGDQMVTAPMSVWDPYVKVLSLVRQLTYHIILTIKLQSHEKARKFISKPFPLYKDIADLCDSVMAMGAGAFRGTCGLDYGSRERAEE